MSKLSDLINKDKPVQASGTVTGRTVKRSNDQQLMPKAKSNAFAALKKSNAKASAATAQPEKKKVSFNLGTKKAVAAPPVAATATDGDAIPAQSASPSGPSSELDTIAQQIIEVKAAKDFVSDDQPDAMSAKAVAQLEKAMDVLYNSMDQKELVGEAIKSVMINLSEHSFLADTLADEDIGAMVRGLRNSYGTVIAKKSAKSSKRAAASADVDDVMNLLGGQGFSIG